MLFGKVGKRAFDMAGAMMPQIDPETQGAINSYAAMPAPKKSGGFFGQGGFGRTLAGFIGDALLQRDGFDPIYGPAMANQQQLMMKQQMAEADRQARFDDWRAQFDYQQAHKAPEDKTPGYIRDAMAFSQLTPEQQALVTKFMDLQNPRFTNTPAGTKFVPRTSVPPNLTPMTEEEIRAMNLNPGGPTPPASGGFRY